MRKMGEKKPQHTNPSLPLGVVMSFEYELKQISFSCLVSSWAPLSSGSSAYLRLLMWQPPSTNEISHAICLSRESRESDGIVATLVKSIQAPCRKFTKIHLLRPMAPVLLTLLTLLALLTILRSDDLHLLSYLLRRLPLHESIQQRRLRVAKFWGHTRDSIPGMIPSIPSA